MNFGLSADKLILIAIIAVVVVGPERLPRYAEGFARLIKRAGEYLRGAKDRVSDEMGPEFKDVDWRKLDPRQYDPRRIIREAILDDVIPATNGAAAAGAGSAATAVAVRPAPIRLQSGEVPPFDAEAT